MRMNFLLLLSVIILLLSFGCADPYIGKKASSWNHYLKRDVMTHEVVKLKHLIFDYKKVLKRINNRAVKTVT